MNAIRKTIVTTAFGIGSLFACTAIHAIDNSSIGKPEFREHKATYGLVYRLPKDVTDILDARIYPPLRDGPLPRCTGPVYTNMSEAARELTRTVGVSGVNVIKDGKETASHNPHNTLVYSMTKYDPRIQAAMKEVADEMNRILPDGIDTQFRDVSIVEIGFMGNVLREFYRISLEDGTAWDVASGQSVKFGPK